MGLNELLTEHPVSRRDLFKIAAASSSALMLEACSNSEKPLTNDETIKREVRRQHITLNQKEQDLHTQFGFDPISIPDGPLNENLQQEAVKRVQNLITIMSKSENQYFKEASDMIVPMNQQKELEIKIITNNLISDLGTEANMTTGFLIKDGKLGWIISIDARTLLSKSSSIKAAIDLTHEAKHLANLVAFQKTLPPDTTVEKRFEFAKARSLDQREYVLEEASGIAQGAQAYILEYGYGYTGSKNNNIHQDAAMFIRCGNTAENECWISYVRSTHIRK